MRLLIVLWTALLLVAFSFAGCENGGAEPPPAAELFADPEVCDVPCEVVLDSGVMDSGDAALTFTWDLGDGPAAGDARLLHRFETEGTHTVSVTVSDGNSTTADDTTVLVQAQPSSSETIDESGGSISQGAARVTIPEGVAPEPISLVLTELPSMQLAAERSLGVGEFTAFGGAYDVDMPLKPSESVAISVKDPQAAGVDPSELAWLVRVVVHPMPNPEIEPLTSSLAPLAGYILVPVTQVDEDGTAHGEIYDRKRFQLVRLSEPLDAEPVALAMHAADKQLPPPSPIVIFRRNPTRITITNYKNAIVDALEDSRSFFIDAGGYRGPEGAIVVYVDNVGNPDWLAYVSGTDRHIIHITHTLPAEDEVRKVIAHEYFHLIQNHHTNRLSALNFHAKDGWFTEGTASWAMDEVFDGITDFYFAPSWTRFHTPFLEDVTNTASRHAYENVAFWKWAETNNPEIIKRFLEDHYSATHSTLAGARNPVENFANVDYLLSLKKIWGDVDFMDFIYKALYVKDFDTGETGQGELWSGGPGANELGRPKEIPFVRAVQVSAGKGDSESTAVETAFGLRPHLTADVIQVNSPDLQGTLHVRFTAPSTPLEAKLIVVDEANYDVLDSDGADDTTTKQELTANFGTTDDAYIFVLDPEWNYASSATPVPGKVEVWVEDPCGPLPTNTIDIGPDDDLYGALTTAPAGSVVRLAAGTYTPPQRDWPYPSDGYELPGNALVKDLTLVGAGEGETILSMSGSQSLYGLMTWGDVSLRNMTIDGTTDCIGIAVLSLGDVTLCNLTVRTRGHDGMRVGQWPWGGDGFLGIYDSTLTHLGSGFGFYGVFASCLEEVGDVNVEIRNSTISGWDRGVSYSNRAYESCSTSVSTDCKGFSDNDRGNVIRTECTMTSCDDIEECP